MAELKHQSEREAQRLAEEVSFREHLTQALKGETVAWSASDRKRLEQLERYAIAIEPSGQHQAAIDLLSELQRPTQPLGAFQLLVDLGLWSEHENLFLRRSQIDVEFSAKVLAVAMNASPHPLQILTLPCAAISPISRSIPSTTKAPKKLTMASASKSWAIAKSCGFTLPIPPAG